MKSKRPQDDVHSLSMIESVSALRGTLLRSCTWPPLWKNLVDNLSARLPEATRDKMYVTKETLRDEGRWSSEKDADRDRSGRCPCPGWRTSSMVRPHNN